MKFIVKAHLWSKADKYYQLGYKLQKIIDRLVFIKNKIKAISVAETTTFFNNDLAIDGGL